MAQLFNRLLIINNKGRSIMSKINKLFAIFLSTLLVTFSANSSMALQRGSKSAVLKFITSFSPSIGSPDNSLTAAMGCKAVKTSVDRGNNDGYHFSF